MSVPDCLAKRLIQKQVEIRIRELENWRLERKASFGYDPSTRNSNEELRKRTCKAIAGFLNARGGVLFIGVDNGGNILGLKNDYGLIKGNNSDRFQLELRNSIQKYLKEEDANELLEIKFHSIHDEEVAEIIVFPSSKPIFFYDNNHQRFFVRIGNSTNPYSISQSIAYCQKRFAS